MAEFVQQRLEDLLPELEQLERVQLFTKDEIRSVVKKRKEFEYRLQRKQKSLEDYTRYIEYERNFLKLIWKRRERLGYKHKKAEIDLKITSRISQLYRVACIRFSDNVDVFLRHVAFCREVKQLAQGSRVLTRLLRLHAHRPAVWVTAAQYELRDNNSPETCRSLMLRAVRLHADSPLVWTQYLRLELEYVGGLRQRQKLLGADSERGDQPAEDEAEDVVMQGAVAGAVAREAVRRLPEASGGRMSACRTVVALLAVCAEFDFAGGLEQQLMEALRRDHPTDPLTYDTLARVALQESRATTKRRLRDRLQTCCCLYDEALERAAPIADVYRLYLTSLMETATTAARHASLVLPRLEEVFQRAQQAGHVTDQIYIKYSDALPDKAVETLQVAAKVCSQSAAVWIKLISVESRGGLVDAVSGRISAALVAVPDSAVGVADLWRLALEWRCENEPDAVDDMFRAAGSRSAPVLLAIKSPYLRWLWARRGPEAARQMYSEHHLRPPIDTALFDTMAQLESEQRPVQAARLRSVYRTGARHVAADDPQFWIGYLAFEQKHGDPANVPSVYEQAVKTLTPAASDVFIAQHTLVTAEVDVL